MFHVVIPARFAATRLPGKPLLSIEGKSLLQWVWECARDSGATSVTVATDDERIQAAARAFGADCELTSNACESGTDRVAELVRRLGFANSDVVLNLQGDEPLTPPALLFDLAHVLLTNPTVEIATAIAPIGSLQEFRDPNIVKALRARDGRALYFSRAPVPWPRDDVLNGSPMSFKGAWRHIGVYGYRVTSLLKFSSWLPTVLEKTEKLEQLRALENGMLVHLLTLAESPPAGVDTLEDLQRVREFVAKRSLAQN